jgi:PAS domain S-box-containing protein
MPDATATELRTLFDVDVVVLWLWDEAEGALLPLVRSYPEGRMPVVGGRVQPGEGICGQAFSTGRVQVASDYPRSCWAAPLAVNVGIRSALAAPLLLGERPTGVLLISTLSPRDFTPSEAETLLFVAGQLAPLAESVRLRAELRRGRGEALALADLARQGLASRDLRELLTLLAAYAVDLLGADYSTVGLAEDDDRVTLEGCYGIRDWRWAQSDGEIGGNVTRAVYKGGSTLVLEGLDDPANGARLGKSAHRSEGACTLLSTPLPSRTGLRGALHAGWRSPHKVTSDQRRIIETLATFGAGMLDSTSAEQRASELARRLQAIIDQMPSGVAVVDARHRLAVLNEAGRDILGLPAESPLASGVALWGPKLQGIFAHHGFDFETTALAGALAGEAVDQAEYRVNVADGRNVWLRSSARQLLDAGGQPAGAVSVFSDITRAREAAERRERETERRLALAAITDALGHAGRDVHAMLRITSRELAHALSSTCVVRLLQGDALAVLEGSVHDDDPKRLRRILRYLSAQPVTLQSGRHRQALEAGMPVSWFDASGHGLHPAGLAAPIRRVVKALPLYALLVAPLHARGEMLGTIGLYRHDTASPFTKDDEAFVADVGARAGLVLENARLFAQLAASRARLEELSQGMVQLAERERRAIALELHDEIGQGLTAARLLLQAARRLPSRLRDERLEEACTTLDEAVAQVRGLSLDLRPPLLDRFGLAVALEGYLERFCDRTGVAVRFQPPEQLVRAAPDVERAAYRVIQEALTNVARHAGVELAQVELRTDNQSLWVRVTDQGRGFDPAVVEWEPSTGLTGMQERAELLGGELVIDTALGTGVQVLARFPLAI